MFHVEQSVTEKGETMTKLFRGVFWITDVENISGSELYFRIPCNENGMAIVDIPPEFSAKNAGNFNHKKLWENLPKKSTSGKPFDYYPRGRVEIRNHTAIVYHSPHIPQDKLKDWLVDKFNLTAANGIRKIRLIADGSEHYRCFLDD